MRLFPEIFDPAALIGIRGRQFRRREDAFQQLVGDGLRELRHGLNVHVSPTRGNDGSIDVFIEPSAGEDDLCLPTMPKPLIVECKDTEGGADLRKNLFTGWREVAERLERQAALGWPGNFAPWRSARAYVYAVSARLPAPQLRIDLRNKISDFFSSLPERPPLEQIVVLDWADLRALWDDAPRLADRWLGVGLETLLGHADQIERFTGFRAYLLEAHLPFLAPAEDDPTHPDVLFSRLSEPGRERGLLLEGPGGVGKSRTLVEVAMRADAAGWRVLHAQAGEPALADEDLESAVLAGSGPTLVVFDYLDQMQLDLVRLRQRLLPAAEPRGIRLALLANARPGGNGQSAARSELFDVVSIRPTGGRAQAITRRLLATVAPHALEQLGHDRLADLCGLRPIIALFIAREIERRAAAGMLTKEQLSGVRSGDMTRWLRRRLKESDLVVPPSPSRLEPASPNPHLVAAAAILAAAPQAETGLTAAGEYALRRAGLDPFVDLSHRSRRLVAVLREMGWLEEREGELAAAHDVVADEVVYDVLADRSAALVRTEELEALLAPARSSARTLGRFAITLRRVLGMEGSTESVAVGLVKESAAWLTREAADLGQLLSRANSVEVSYALGSVIHGEPWSEAAFSVWDTLVAPFLAAHGGQPAARHLLYRGLSKLPERRGRLLFPVALRWLEHNGCSLEASFVSVPLLNRGDLEPDEVRDAVAWNLSWLKSFGSQVNAKFVLNSLLSRGDLEPDKARDATALSLSWLQNFGSQVEAGFILDPLLSRGDLEPDKARDAVACSLSWLQSFGSRVEARFVLHRLLSRGDLEPDKARDAIACSLSWLRSFGSRIEAQFVLNPLLSRGDLEPDKARDAIACSLSWLQNFGSRVEAMFVLDPLLSRGELNSDRARDAVACSLSWLQSFGSRVEAQFVLNSLLSRGDLEPDKARDAVALSLSWLQNFGPRVEAMFVLDPLLSRGDLESHEASDAVARSLSWLESFGSQVEAGFVLPPLLSRGDLATDEVSFAVAHALAWLRTGHESAGEDFVLKSLLSRNDLGTRDLLEAQLSAADWVRAHPLEADACFMLKRLLTRKDLAPGVVQAAVDSGVVWFEANADHPQADFVFSRLLRRKQELKGELRLRVAQLGVAWLRQVPMREDRDFALSSLLWNAGLLDESDRRFLVDDASGWLALAPRSVETVGRLEAVLRRLVREHSEDAWITDMGVLERTTATEFSTRAGSSVGSEFLLLTRELAERARDSTSVPAADWLARAVDQTEREVEGEHPASAGFALQGLLPLVLRTAERELGERVGGLAARFLANPRLTPKNRLGFANGCYRLLDEGAWPDREMGERILASLRIERPPAFSGTEPGVSILWTLEREAVRIAASAGPLPSPDWLDLALLETAKPIENGFPKASGFLFPPLLPLVAHFGSATAQENLENQIRVLLSDPSFSLKGRARFAEACYRFLGAWPNREEGERILVSLGIERPAE